MATKSSKTQLILDTNIVQYGCDGKYSEELLELLTRLRSKYEFAVSSITVYEFFAGLNGKKKATRMSHGKVFLDTLDNIPVENSHLKVAAALRTVYKCNEQTKSFEGNFSFADGLIGATSMAIGAHILTGNSNDFPSPLFDEKEVFDLKPATERRQKISILVPDIAYFNAEVKRVYGQSTKA